MVLAMNNNALVKSAKQLGMPKTTLFYWRTHDPDFARLYALTKEEFFVGQGERVRQNAEKAAKLLTARLEDDEEAAKISAKELSLIAAINLDKALALEKVAKRGRESGSTEQRIRELQLTFEKIGGTDNGQNDGTDDPQDNHIPRTG